MRKDIAQRWVQALRSGKFRQAKRRLRVDRSDGPAQFCCLGVLCELAVADGVIPPYDGYYGGSGTLLPEAVQNWAGLERSDAYYGGHFPPLSIQNDNGKTFTEIADIIEANVSQL